MNKRENQLIISGMWIGVIISFVVFIILINLIHPYSRGYSQGVNDTLNNYTCIEKVNVSYFHSTPTPAPSCDYCQYSWNFSKCINDMSKTKDEQLYQEYLCHVEENKLKYCINDCLR
jgi:hypothetical protein